MGALLCSSCGFNIVLDGKCTVTYKNYNGDVLYTQKVDVGGDASYKGNVPVKPIVGKEAANVFIGWDKPLTNVRRNQDMIAQFKTLDKIIDKDRDGIPEGIDTNDDPTKNGNYFEVGAKSYVYLDTNITIDFSKFLEPNANMNYDNEIAKLGLFLSNPKVDFKDGLFDEKVYGGRENAIYSRLGCDDFHHFDFCDEARDTYKYDKYDTTSGCYAHKYLYNTDGSIAKDLIIIAFDGTHGSERWSSNFDVGDDSEYYYSKTGGEGSHPEWTDTNFHKGFYVAAKRVLNDTADGGTKEGPVKFLKYIDEHSSKSNGEPIIFVTGHSRGGAIATLVGDYLERQYTIDTEKKCIPFTYAFASPSVWGAGKSKPNLQTVHNVINNDDIVTKVPFSEWGFERLGKEDVNETVYESYYDLYNKNKDGRIYQRVEHPESIFANLGCKGRKEIYNFNVEGDKQRYMSNIALDSFKTKDEAEKKKEELKKPYAEQFGEFFNYINLEVVEYEFFGTKYYDVYSNCCLGTFTSLIGYVMTSDKQVMDNLAALIPLISNTKIIEFAVSLGANIAAGGTDTVALPHDYGAYQIILREYKEPAK